MATTPTLITATALATLVACSSQTKRSDSQTHDRGRGDEATGNSATNGTSESSGPGSAGVAGSDSSAQPRDTAVTADPVTAGLVTPAWIEPGPWGEYTGEIIAFSTISQGGGRSQWTLTLGGDGQVPRTSRIIAPEAIAPPFTKGQKVRAAFGQVGGGPNAMGTVVLHDATGALLAAINQLPDDWMLEAGRTLKKEDGVQSDLLRRAVRFETGGHSATVTPDAPWSRLQAAGAAYYVYGSAVERVRKDTHRPPPPDYVKSWVDFAIVRAP